MTAPIQTPEELALRWFEKHERYGHDGWSSVIRCDDSFADLARRIRERDEAIRADALKGAASPPAAPPPDEAVRAAPDPITDEWLPPGILDPHADCYLEGGGWLPDMVEDRDAAWRAALRAERERAFLEGQKRGAHATLAMVVASSPETVRSVAGISMDEAIKAERASADARVRRMAEAFLNRRHLELPAEWGVCCPNDHASDASWGRTEKPCADCEWLRAHEPTLAAELGAAEGGA